jgi:hypothetical protein
MLDCIYCFVLDQIHKTIPAIYMGELHTFIVHHHIFFGQFNFWLQSEEFYSIPCPDPKETKLFVQF